MEISLVRHGKSQLTENDKITLLEFKQWVEKYNNHGVFEQTTYPFETIEKVSNAKMVVSSNLRRAIESAKLLKPEVNLIINPIFRETELPTQSMKLLKLKFKPSFWAVLFRLLWFCGYSNDCESLSNAKLRAKQASQQLIDYANEYTSIVLVGHGFFNRLVAKELQKKGWKGKRKTYATHWNCTTFSLIK